MTQYATPEIAQPPAAEPRVVYTVPSGDLRPSANVAGWPTQQKFEADVAAALGSYGWRVHRAHEFDPDKGHGFIDTQRLGMEVFKTIRRTRR
jgi:hypothetical protein